MKLEFSWILPVVQVSPIESLRLMCLLSITENGESQGPKMPD